METWLQVNIAYPGESIKDRERRAVPHLINVLPAAEAAGIITSWWFMRKRSWRIRYRLAEAHHGPDAVRPLLTDAAPLTSDIYEPEVHAFGGVDSMDAAHKLFHHDSRHLLTYLEDHPTDRRERSLILCTVLMRAAGLDLNEQGDVWARVAERRAALLPWPTTPQPRVWATFTDGVRHLILGTARTTSDWHTAFGNAGATLRVLRETGKLTRGLRAVIAEHVIFHWNRIGLPATTQAVLAQAAKEAIFGNALPLKPPDQVLNSTVYEVTSTSRPSRNR